jgi:glycosidase
MEWLKDAVLYQIYPQSFQDTNGDGIGDFQGIISRLDYIKSLGVNTLWLNPCFDSPFGDAGYDVRNFYKVAPRYGEESDLVALFDEAHKRDMRVILDLVAGHTSMDNEWFVKEAKDPTNPDSNRYIWKNRDFDVEKGPDKEDFVSNFFWYQPALNYGYHNPTEDWQDPIDAPGPQKNRQELLDILAYWYDRGCDGFRVDMAASLVKGEWEHKTETINLWKEIRSWMDAKYPGRALVAEWSEPSDAVPAGFHLDFMMHFNAPGYASLFFNGKGTLPAKEGPCYFDPKGEGSLDIFRDEYPKQLKGTRGLGYVSLPSANHDFQRQRVGDRTWEGLPPSWVFLMTQAGIPTIYYGDEIGMRFVTGTPAKEGSTLLGVDAPNAGAPDGERSGTRTPMQWDSSVNDGFSTAPADQLYLPMDDDPDRPTVEKQEADTDGLIHFIRTLAKLRVDHPALGADGEFEFLNPQGDDFPFVYKRSLDGASYLVVTNPLDREATISLSDPSASTATILDGGVTLSKGNITAPAFGYGIFKL